MRLLVLGGTRFIGPHIVRKARERGHEVTLFNRGETDPDRFEELEQIRGDREDGDYEGLTTDSWDAVIDTSGYYPRAIRQALAVLEDRCAHYLFISSTSVYDEFDPAGYDEDAPLKTLDDPDVEEVTPRTYGGLKALCEEALAEFEVRRTVVRPGLVAGPGDHTDRFTYWPVKFSRRSEVLVPGTPEDPIQYIDVRDLAEFLVGLLESETPGTFNAVTPRGRHTIGELVERCCEVVDDPAEPVWVDDEFLLANEVSPWNELPLWVPPESSIGGIPHAISQRAVEAGLRFRSLRETMADTFAWFMESRDDQVAAGLADDRERDLLDAYGSR